MTKRVIVLALMIMLVPVFSNAEGEPLFTKKYERGKGKPLVVTDTVAACNTGASYKLVVVNGDGGEGGKSRVSSASVVLNGDKVVGERDFNQRIGIVEVPVSLSAENSIEVQVASKPGSFITVSLLCEANCLGVEITSPGDGDGVGGTRAIVEGSIINLYGETGVTLTASSDGGVDRALAYSQDEAFAGLVGLKPGSNTITATATDACGYRATDTVVVSSDQSSSTVNFSATPDSGVPSLETGTMEVYFKADGGVEVMNYAWDFDGDGTADEEGAELSEVTASYAETGLFFPTLTVTYEGGASGTEVAVVSVMTLAEVEEIVEAKWDGMKEKLGSGNVEGALKYFAFASRAEYFKIFSDPEGSAMEAISSISDVELYEVRGRVASGGAIRYEDGEPFSYPLAFVRDTAGIWRILGF